MRDTIKAKDGYRVFKTKSGGNDRIVCDGETPLFLAELVSHDEYIDEMRNNEMFNLCEVFTTRKGQQYAYWRDEEFDVDYITKLS